MNEEILNTDLLKDYQDFTELVNQALNQRDLIIKSALLNLESSKEGVTIARIRSLAFTNCEWRLFLVWK